MAVFIFPFVDKTKSQTDLLLRHTQHSMESFTRVSRSPHGPVRRALPPTLQMREPGLGDLPKATQTVSGNARLRIQAGGSAPTLLTTRLALPQGEN